MLPGQMRGWTIRAQGYRVTGGVLPADQRQSWTRTIEKDLSALSCLGLHPAWRRAQDREQWQRTVEAAMLQRGACP